MEEAEAAQPVVDGDDYHVAAPGEGGAVVEELRAGAQHEGAPMDPHEDRPPRAVGSGVHIVQVKAVLAGLADPEAEDRPHLRGVLWGRRTEAPGLADAVPRCRRLGRAEAERAHRRPRERDAAEDHEISFLAALQPPRLVATTLAMLLPLYRARFPSAVVSRGGLVYTEPPCAAGPYVTGKTLHDPAARDRARVSAYRAAAGRNAGEPTAHDRGGRGCGSRPSRGTLPEDDLLFSRMDITDPGAVALWVRNLEAGLATTVIAEVNGETAGYASWSRTASPGNATSARSVPQVGLSVPVPRPGARSRRRDLLHRARAGLRKIVAQMTTDQKGAIATFERLGFQPEALLQDFVVDHAGRTRDLVVMAYDVTGLTEFVE